MAKPQTKNEDTEWGEKIATNTEFRKSSALEDGQSIIGTVVAFQESAKFPGNIAVVMIGTDGKKFALSPSGNLKYAIRDGLLEKGKTYKITREGTKKVKGMTSTNFGIYPSKKNLAASAADSNDI